MACFWATPRHYEVNIYIDSTNTRLSKVKFVFQVARFIVVRFQKTKKSLFQMNSKAEAVANGVYNTNVKTFTSCQTTLISYVSKGLKSILYAADFVSILSAWVFYGAFSFSDSAHWQNVKTKL